MVTVQVQNLINFVAEVFAHADSSPEEARRIATYLTTANLTGHDSHGVVRVPRYVRMQSEGRVVAATFNNFFAVAVPGKAFICSPNWIPATTAITASAIPIARMAGWNAVFFQLRFAPSAIFSFANHS